jgi:hypothetical protein
MNTQSLVPFYPQHRPKAVEYPTPAVYPPSINLACQHRGSRDFVWRAVAHGLALAVVDGDEDTGIGSRVSTGERDC